MPFVRIYYDASKIFSFKEDNASDKHSLLETLARVLSRSLATHLLDGDPQKDSSRVKVVWLEVGENYLNMPPLSIRIEAGWSPRRAGELDSIIEAVKEDIKKEAPMGISVRGLLLKFPFLVQR